jgi:catechol 2,3-dioxygenase-like lactoylglutathione lyase family enzyme
VTTAASAAPARPRDQVLAGASLAEAVVRVRDVELARRFYEERLGFVPQDGAVYRSGAVRLRLADATRAGVTLPERDDWCDLTFHVADLPLARAQLESRGISFSDTLTYEIGSTADFHDPDGHWMSLYQPSAVALTWPSGDALRTLAGAGPPGRLPLVYAFTFVPDADVAFAFYHELLGLRWLECRPCRRGSTTAERGVVKYDANGLMLTTHHRDVDPEGDAAAVGRAMRAVDFVFEVPSVVAATRALDAAGVECAVSPEGVARFEDPFGRAISLAAADHAG